MTSAPRTVGGLLLLLLTILAYRQVTDNGWVNFDDPTYVQDNPLVRGGLTLENIGNSFTHIQGGYWIPLTWISYQIDYELAGMAPSMYHRTNLLLHLGAVLLLYLILLKATARTLPSFFVAALFALHPVQVESVAWITERKDVLSTVFWMLTTWAYLRWVEAPAWPRYLWILLFLALGLMAKPMLVTLPCTLMLLDLWPLDRWRDKGFLRLLWEKAPLFLLALSVGALTLIAQDQGSAVRTLEEFSVEARVENMLVGYVEHLGLILWPMRLAVFYPHPGESLPLWRALLCVMLLSLITLMCLSQRRARPYLLVGWLWYLGTLFPVSGVMQAGWQGKADRFLYVPSIGLYLILCWGIADLARSARARRVAVALGGLVLIGCVWLTSLQVPHWRNSLTLWEHALASTKSNFISHLSYASALLDAGRTEEALTQLRLSLEHRPDHFQTHHLLGVAQRQRSLPEKAIASFEQALQLEPHHASTHAKLAQVLAEVGRVQEAESHVTTALDSEPSSAEAHFALGVIREEQGRKEEALKSYRRAAELNPHRPPYREAVRRLSHSP